jgi:hypothetical protein
MTPSHRRIVRRELLAIKRAIARIEASFEGVPKLLQKAQRKAASRRGNSRARP